MQKIIFISPQNIFNPSSGVESRVNNLIKYFSKQNILYIFAPKPAITSEMIKMHSNLTYLLLDLINCFQYYVLHTIW